MKLISEALQEKGLKQNELPEQITKEIDELRAMIVKYNEACDEYDEEEDNDEETEERLDAMEDAIAEFEKSIAEEIRGLGEQKPKVAADGTQTEEKKSSSLGWLLFGGVALALTIGAVNVFKKK
jgi:hypothetical protein